MISEPVVDSGYVCPAFSNTHVGSRFCQMRIISPKGTIDTEKEGVVLMFNDDNELSSFISLLVKTPVRSTGVRLLTLIPDNVELTPLQMSILNVLEGMDGIGGNDNETICDNTIDGIKDILKS